MGLAPMLVDQIFEIIGGLKRQGITRAAGRAECLCGAGHRRSRLCHRDRKDLAYRHRPRAAERRPRADGLFGSLKFIGWPCCSAAATCPRVHPVRSCRRAALHALPPAPWRASTVFVPHASIAAHAFADRSARAGARSARAFVMIQHITQTSRARLIASRSASSACDRPGLAPITTITEYCAGRRSTADSVLMKS